MLRKLTAVAVVLGLCLGASAQDRVSATEQGSVLIFPKVELRWDSSDNLIQDTFISLSNNFNEDVWILAYFVSENCNWVDNDFVLTHNQPAYWSVATGLPGPDDAGLSPWTVLGAPYADPEGSSDMVHRGFIVLWAINNAHEEIRWNYLTGHATIVNYEQTSAWEYNAYAFSALNVEHGEQTGDPGVISFDGVEFDFAFNRLLLDFFASGAKAFSSPVFGDVIHDTDLTLLIVDMDLRQETQGPYITKAFFEIWNEQEVSFSGVEFCFTKWDQSLLSSIGGHFLVENLQTDKGRARIDGVESQVVCPGSSARAILGVAAKYLEFASGEIGMAGTNLVGTGTEATEILYDIPEPPEEKSLDGGLEGVSPVGRLEKL